MQLSPDTDMFTPRVCFDADISRKRKGTGEIDETFFTENKSFYIIHSFGMFHAVRQCIREL